MNADEIPITNGLKSRPVEYRESMGKTYAFVTCIDLGLAGKGAGHKHYWGEVTARGDAGELHQIMTYGGKWDNLPACT